MRWIENVSPKYELLKNLAIAITNAQTDSVWKLYYPARYEDIVDIFVIMYYIDNQYIYIEFFNPNYKVNHCYMECRFGTNYVMPQEVGVPGVFPEDCGSIRFRYAWSGYSINAKKWFPVKYAISIDEERIVMLLSGDLSISESFDSFAFIGKISQYDNSIIYKYNFGITVSSDLNPVEYLTQDELNTYGNNTSDGVTSFCLWKTLTGFPFQAHFVSFTTPDEFLNKTAGASKYTKGYHFSKVNILNPYSGVIGILENIRVSTDNNLKIGTDLAKFNEVSMKDRVYSLCKISAPYSIFNNSPNVLASLGILKYDNASDHSLDNLQIYPKSATIHATESYMFRAFLGDMEITNMGGAVWTCSEPSYKIIQGTVTSSLVVGSVDITVTYLGKSATANLNVLDAEFYVVPQSRSVPIGVENLEYKCYYGSNEVTPDVVWTLDNLELGSMSGNKFTSSAVPGEAKVIATYTLDEVSKVDQATLSIYDVEFKLVTNSTTVQINHSAEIKAIFGDKDVTDIVDWSIDLPYNINKGVTAPLTSLEKVTVSASYGKMHKTASLELTVVDLRTLVVTPKNQRIPAGEGNFSIQYKAMLDTVDVTDQCIWSTAPTLSINEHGYLEGPRNVIDTIVTAVYQPTNKLDATNLTVYTNVIEHPYDFCFQLDWDMILHADLDLHAVISLPSGSSEVYFVNREFTTDGGNSGVWLDHDNTRQKLSGIRTDVNNMETISVLAMQGVSITMLVNNFSGVVLSTNPRIRMYDKNNNLLRTFDIDRLTITQKGRSVKVLEFISHVNGNNLEYEIK